MEAITQSEYYTECKNIAEELVKECEGDEGAIQDRLHETVDGHQWIVDTFYNLQVLQHSKNENAYFDNFGPLQADSFSDVCAKMAFVAMEADVQEYLSDAIKNYKAEI